MTPDGESTVDGQRSTVDRRPSTLHSHPTGIELLDDPFADDAQVRESLRHIARANRWFGGASAVRWAVTRMLPGVCAGKTLTMLDVGAGAGDLARVAQSAARSRGVELRVVCLDRHPAAARVAAAAGCDAVAADAGALPFGNRSVDLVLLSQLVHHFGSESAVMLLRESARVARRGVIVADLRPSRVAAALFGPAARALGFDRITVHDGLTSLRRAYSPEALGTLMHRAGLDSRVFRRPGWRLVALAPLT